MCVDTSPTIVTYFHVPIIPIMCCHMQFTILQDITLHVYYTRHQLGSKKWMQAWFWHDLTQVNFDQIDLTVGLADQMSWFS